MDNKAQHLLRNALHKYGIDIIHEPFKLNSVLKDYAKGQFEAEIFLLVLSATQGVVNKLIKCDDSSRRNVGIKLSLELHENLGIDKVSAVWTINSWLFALNLKLDSTSSLRLSPHDNTQFSNRDDKSFFVVDQTTKKLAVLFADICNSTALYDSIGDDLARHFTANCIKLMTKEISPYDGTLIKTIGDEIMCTFPSAKLALNAACAMQKSVKDGMAELKQQLSIRIGFHYGYVISEANDVFGDTVNVAARVSGIAKAEQIITTAAVYDELSSTLQKKIRRFKTVDLKGKQEQLEVYWVSWQEENKENYDIQSSPPISAYATKFSTPVILKYIPQNTTYRQILEFVKPSLKGGLFDKAGKIERVLVLAQKEELFDITDFHAILYIQPDEAAKRVIKELHRKPLNDHYTAVSEYVERSVYNERRSNIQIKDEQGCKRFTERRKKKIFRLITIEQLKDFDWNDSSNIEN